MSKTLVNRKMENIGYSIIFSKKRKVLSRRFLEGTLEVPGEPLFLYFIYLLNQTINTYSLINQRIIYLIEKTRLNEIKKCSTNVVPNQKEPLSL